LELEEKGGLVVAATDEDLGPLSAFADGQREHGLAAEGVPADRLREYEPHLSTALAGGVAYPEDLQVQPVLAASTLVAAARAHGARLHTGTGATSLERGPGGRVAAVRAGDRRFHATAVVNAAGTWGGSVAEAFGAPVPVLPRRGFVLVTEPLPRVVRRKVYTADYVGNVASDDAGLETSVVVEGTRGGTVLIGASRERVGFDGTFSVDVVRRLAAQAVRIFPVLADVCLLRVYHGFRPYCPDHLPVIGADPRVDGLFHACGHEGAGVGLAPATGRLVTQLVTGAEPGVDPAPFSPGRFEQVPA
ncbi:MAG: NAD(P)/FAD-dependent oxidoreductase, partial [Nocardioidaceae bacterium]